MDTFKKNAEYYMKINIVVIFTNGYFCSMFRVYVHASISYTFV